MPINKFAILAFCLILSMLLHIIGFYALNMFGNYNFAGPVNPLQTVLVDVMKTGAATVPAAQIAEQVNNAPADEPDLPKNAANIKSVNAINDSAPPASQKNPHSEDQVRFDESLHSEKAPEAHQPVVSRLTPPIHVFHPPLRTATEFMATKAETLSYLSLIHI